MLPAPAAQVDAIFGVREEMLAFLDADGPSALYISPVVSAQVALG